VGVGAQAPLVLRARDAGLAVLVAVIWGLAFVATRVGLDTFSPPQLVVLRFAIAAVPALALPRPPLPWPALIPVGLTLFAGQFLFQFFGIALGMPPGLASVIVQTQALFTIVFAALALGERPSPAQWAGSAVALAGLGLIALTVAGAFSPAAFALTLVSPVSFGIGNVLLKRLGPADMTSLMAWLSLVPPLPVLALSLFVDGPLALPRALAAAPAAGVAAALFLGVVATSLAYALWGALLRRYPAATVAPFALLVPFVAALSSALVFGERFGSLRLAGMALVLAGVAVSVASRRPWGIKKDRPY
jgi:O-acetylserine/cysteine efflux transporter